jgi:hypothetical protein
VQAKLSFEMSVDIQQTTLRYIPEDKTELIEFVVKNNSISNCLFQRWIKMESPSTLAVMIHCNSLGGTWYVVCGMCMEQLVEL